MILLLTHAGDFYTIDGVEAALQRFGAQYLRLDTDRFPMEYTLTSRAGEGSFLEAGGQTLALSQTTAVWNRRLYPGHVPPELPFEQARFSAETCRTAFLNAFDRLDQAYWINPLRAQDAAESKLLQLDLAREVGLRVPPTLITNRPQEVRDFAQHHPRLVTKLLVQQVQSMQAHPAFAYTTRVQPEHLDQLEQLRLMPQIFQPELTKKVEYRAVAVGGKLFVGGLRGLGDLIDWRQAPADSGLAWEKATFDGALHGKILLLMQRLGLRFGALDFIDDGTGEPWFLECNPAGEWGWLERDLGMPIAETIARALVDRS
ncbi:MvdC family ATP-grasp ribosomal peptide maturase [bacterium CPR1]|nr:MvdC family ATP-grasp ribosomal peptide maturase [bacterium CPR1]